MGVNLGHQLDTVDAISLIRESWEIEGLQPPTNCKESPERLLIEFCKIEKLSVYTFMLYADLLIGNGCELRENFGMNVQIGNHIPIQGGPLVRPILEEIIQDDESDLYEQHKRFLNLHPLMDGNGRMSRVLWTRRMIRSGKSVKRGFLLNFYYDTLEKFDKE